MRMGLVRKNSEQVAGCTVTFWCVELPQVVPVWISLNSLLL